MDITRSARSSPRPGRALGDNRDGRGLMKTMTCRQLGGACDLALHGETADDVIKAQDAHLKEVVAAGDEAHQSALSDMKGRWKNPLKGMGWYRSTKRAFAALPDD